MKSNEVGTYKQAEAKCDLASGFRRVAYQGYNVILPIEPLVAVALPVKLARKLTSLKLTQLVRQQKKFARRASTAKFILADMSPGRIRSAVEGQQGAALNCFRQVCAEIKARALACEGKLAEAE